MDDSIGFESSYNTLQAIRTYESQLIHFHDPSGYYPTTERTKKPTKGGRKSHIVSTTSSVVKHQRCNTHLLPRRLLLCCAQHSELRRTHSFNHVQSWVLIYVKSFPHLAIFRRVVDDTIAVVPVSYRHPRCTDRRTGMGMKSTPAYGVMVCGCGSHSVTNFTDLGRVRNMG